MQSAANTNKFMTDPETGKSASKSKIITNAIMRAAQRQDLDYLRENNVTDTLEFIFNDKDDITKPIQQRNSNRTPTG